jgi:hypothetical protein
VLNANGKSLTPTVPPEFRFAGSQARASKGQHIKRALYVKAENGLRFRDRKIGRLLEKMRSLMPWLEESDIPACRAWAQCEVMVDMAYAILQSVDHPKCRSSTRRANQGACLRTSFVSGVSNCNTPETGDDARCEDHHQGNGQRVRRTRAGHMTIERLSMAGSKVGTFSQALFDEAKRSRRRTAIMMICR